MDKLFSELSYPARWLAVILWIISTPYSVVLFALSMKHSWEGQRFAQEVWVACTLCSTLILAYIGHRWVTYWKQRRTITQPDNDYVVRFDRVLNRSGLKTPRR